MARMMEVAFKNGVMAVNRDNGMVNLNEALAIGNMYRKERGMSQLSMDDYLRRRDTWEFIMVLDSKSPDSGELKTEQSGQLSYSDLVKSTDLIITKKGRYGGTYADVYIALDMASWMNPEFKMEVYKTFLEQKIVGVRNSGADKFREFTEKMTAKFRDIRTSDYVTMAVEMNRKVNGEYIKGWDHKNADTDKQQLRLDIINACCMMIEMGYVTSVPQLCSFIERYTR
ncbi:MAG: KilA-N domain-containing protein [Paraclostridium sp.]